MANSSPLFLKSSSNRNRRAAISVIFLLCVVNASYAQLVVSPASNHLRREYFKNSSVFHKLTWIDKAGRVSRQATLNLVTRIDSIQNQLTHLQIRNDGKKDSSVSEFPSLKPIYVSSMNKGQGTVYDYRGGEVKVTSIKNSKPEPGGTFKIANQFFDGFLGEYLLGALPLKPGFTAKFETFRGEQKLGVTSINSVMQDVQIDRAGRIIPIYVVSINSANFDYLVWLNAVNGDVLKSVFAMPDGGYFIKERI